MHRQIRANKTSQCGLLSNKLYEIIRNEWIVSVVAETRPTSLLPLVSVSYTLPHHNEQPTMATDDTTNPTRPPPPPSPPSHYDVLQISWSATSSGGSGNTAKPSPPTLSEITQAYHRAARRCHPDRRRRSSLSHQDDDDEEFRRIQQAWECLRDAERRKAYDAAQQWRHIRQRQRQNSAIRIAPADCYEGECECDDEYDVEEEEEQHVIELWYDCRCGHAVAIAEADPDDQNLVECQGCSLLYDTTPVWQQQQQDKNHASS